MRYKTAIFVLISMIGGIIGCTVESEYKTRTFMSEEERAEIDLVYNPPEKEDEEIKEIPQYLQGVEGGAIRVNGYDIAASDIQELFEYYVSFRKEDVMTLKRQAAGEWIETYAVMTQWPGTIDAALERINEIKETGDAGAEFVYLIAENSQEPQAADRGGDLGEIKRGMMAAIFEMHVFTGGVNEIIGPFPTVFGWHLLQISERNETDVNNPTAHARHLLLFHGLNPAHGELIRQNVQRWVNTAQIELLTPELNEVLPRFAEVEEMQEANF